MTPSRAMASRWSTPTQATSTVWPRRRECWAMASHLRSAPATVTPNLKWKECWRSWASPKGRTHRAQAVLRPEIPHEPPRPLCLALFRRLRQSQHRSFHDSRKQLVELDHGMHRPWNNHLPLLLPETVERRASHPLCRDAPKIRRPNFFEFAPAHRMGAEIGPYIPRTDGQHVDIPFSELDPSSFAHGIHREFASGV